MNKSPPCIFIVCKGPSNEMASGFQGTAFQEIRPEVGFKTGDNR